MNLILNEISTTQNWENQFNCYARKNLLNSINSKLINQSNFENFQNFIQAIVQKGPRKSKKRWVSNQRRILCILLNCLSVINKKPVRDFNNPEILKINRVFSYKERHSIEYEIRKLSTNNKQNRRRWSEEQENFLQDIVKKTQNKNKWNEIARQLFINSKGEYFRQGKHCRQRFYKLKDGKGQFSLSGEIASDESSEPQNQMQFHSQESAKLSIKELLEEQIPNKMKIEDFQKISMSKIFDQNCEKQKSSACAGILRSSNSKERKSQKIRTQKQRRTHESQEGGKSSSYGSSQYLNDNNKMQNGNQEQIEHGIPSMMNVEEKQNLESQKNQNDQIGTQGMLMPGMGYGGMGMGINMNQMQNGNGVMDPAWYNMIGYWPMGAFSFPFQGFY